MPFPGEPAHTHEGQVPGLFDARRELREEDLAVLVEVMPDLAGDDADLRNHTDILLCGVRAVKTPFRNWPV